MLDLFYPPKPPKTEPTRVHIMRGVWAIRPVTEDALARMAEYNKTRRKELDRKRIGKHR